MALIGRFPYIFPEFIAPNVVPDTEGVAGTIGESWRSCDRPQPNEQFTNDPVEIARRRCWYFIRTGQLRTDCPAHQRVVTKLLFDFLEHPDVWAGATTKENVNIIGASAGLARNVSAFAQVLLSHPKVLPEFGDPSKERTSFQSLRNCDWMSGLTNIEHAVQWTQRVQSGLPKPQTFERQKIAELLAVIALDFVFWHEITHLRRGHVHFLKTEYGDSTYNEFDGQIDNVDIRHALELEADNGALEIMICAVLQGGTIRSFQMEKEQGAEYLEMFFLAGCLLFLMFDSGTTPDTDYESSTHPHPLVRYWNLVSHGAALARAANWDIDHFKDIAIQALELVGLAAIAADLPNAMMAEMERLGIRGISRNQQRITSILNELVATHPSLRI